MKNLIIAFVLAPLLGLAGVPQVKDARLSKQTVKQAQLEDKLILVISHAPHGGGSTALLEDRYISQFLNKYFIIEKQVSDSGQGSYLIYNQQRKLVHRVADEKYPYELAVKIKRALDTRTQYYTLLSRFENGDRSANVLINLIIGASDAADFANAPQFMRAYLETLPAQPTEADLRFISRHTIRSSDPGFTFLLDRSNAVEKLADIIFEETFAAHLNDKNVDVALLVEQTKDQYPVTALTQQIDRMPLEFLEMREDWEGLHNRLPTYLTAYKTQLSPAQVEYYNWLLNTHSVGK